MSYDFHSNAITMRRHWRWIPYELPSIVIQLTLNWHNLPYSVDIIVIIAKHDSLTDILTALHCNFIVNSLPLVCHYIAVSLPRDLYFYFYLISFEYHLNFIQKLKCCSIDTRESLLYNWLSFNWHSIFFVSQSIDILRTFEWNSIVIRFPFVCVR